MEQHLKESTSLWMSSKTMPSSGKLQSDLTTEVCIVGAGISGITTAYCLALQGKKVIVVDQGDVGSGQTCRSTAHLSNAIDGRYFEIEKLHGESSAKLAAESHTRAIDKIEEICAKEKIECDFKRVDGYLFAPDFESWEMLQKELDAARRAGLTEVELVIKPSIPWLINLASLKFPNQAQLNPRKYLHGLATAVLKLGGKIYSGAHITDVTGDSPVFVTAKSGYTVVASDVVVATNTPINDRFVIHTKQSAYRTYAAAYEIALGSIPTALYWETISPYHYIRLERDGEKEYLIVGGEDHRTGQSKDEHDCIARLDYWTRERFPQVNERKFTWSGQIEETIDGLAYIGRNPRDSRHVYIVTGDSGMGMTHGTIAGLLLTDLIQERNNSWAMLYDPSRKPLLTLQKWIKENSNTVAQYGDYFKEGEVDFSEQVFRGEGAILRSGLKKIAVYRDGGGMTHKFSAVCPHLGGCVRWNSEEKTWDCPCHGSRFSAIGEVINGPAISGLTEVSDSNIDEPVKEYVNPYSLGMNWY